MYCCVISIFKSTVAGNKIDICPLFCLLSIDTYTKEEWINQVEKIDARSIEYNLMKVTINLGLLQNQ